MKINLLLIALLTCCYTSAQPAKSNLVQRNRNAGITFIKDQIYQDDRDIGGVQMSQGTEKGQIVRTLTVYYTDGSKVAEAKSYGEKSHEWSILTLKDKHTHVITSPSGNDAIDVIKYLIKGYYL